jgi:4-amino-4-deoxy-L-arabinose transferase-like glycosyltransferase
MMAAYAGALYCTWKAAATRDVRWWIALGACWGLGMLSKYHMAVPIACNLAWLWTLREGRRGELVRGVLVASVTAGILLVPHVLWLVDNYFPTFEYAATRVAAGLGFVERLDDIFRFTTHQMLRFASLGVLLGLFAWYQKRHPGTAVQELAPVDPDTRRFFAIHAFGPIIAMVVLCALFGIDLQSHWGTAFLWVVPLYLLATPYGARLTQLPLSVIVSFSVVVQVLSMLAYASGKFGGNFGG